MPRGRASDAPPDGSAGSSPVAAVGSSDGSSVRASPRPRRAGAASRRSAAAAAVGLAGLLTLAANLVAAPPAEPSGVDEAPAKVPAPTLLTVDQAVRAGTHARLILPQGPVHVWIPSGYHPDGAVTVLYVHGYYDSVDSAWANHKLPEQFALSGINALFIAPEAPQGIGQPVLFPDVIALVQEVESRMRVWRGSGPLVAVGHSGAYRTLQRWLDEPLLDLIVLVDGLYGEQESFGGWLAAAPSHRLITVGEDTVRWTEELAMSIADTVIADHFPIAAEGWTAEQRAARHLYVRSQFGHMQQVTGGVALPLLLRLLPAARLPETAWHEPLGQLPIPWSAAPDPVEPDPDDAGTSGSP